MNTLELETISSTSHPVGCENCAFPERYRTPLDTQEQETLIASGRSSTFWDDMRIKYNQLDALEVDGLHSSDHDFVVVAANAIRRAAQKASASSFADRLDSALEANQAWADAHYVGTFIDMR